MNGDRAVSGVLMLAAAAALAWAWLSGRLDGAIGQVTARATGTAAAAKKSAATLPGFGRAGRES